MKEVEFLPGDTIDKSIEELQRLKLRYNQDVYGVFNGKRIDSTMSKDEVYVTIVGLTENEFNTQINEDNKRYKLEQEEHKNSIPEKTKFWIEEGKKYIQPEYLELWDKCVPIRLEDLYQGMELEACIEIIKVLNKSDNFEEVYEEAKQTIDNQGHSGMSFGLVVSMVKSFHKHGQLFLNKVK